MIFFFFSHKNSDQKTYSEMNQGCTIAGFASLCFCLAHFFNLIGESLRKKSHVHTISKMPSAQIFFLFVCFLDEEKGAHSCAFISFQFQHKIWHWIHSVSDVS